MIFAFCITVMLVHAEENNAMKNVTEGEKYSLRNLCPFNKFCGSNPLMTIKSPEYEPCCEECSCDSNCYETGGCCPDMPLFGPVEQKYPCRHLWEFGKIDGIKQLPRLNDYWYHVINKCPDEYVDSSNHKCYMPTKVQDFAIVTDKETGKLYRNKHCAECHKIQNYEKLSLRVDCPDIRSYEESFTDLTAEEREKYIMENCSILSLPPPRRIGTSRCLPKNKVISACNVTGGWDFFDNEIQRGCMTQDQERNMVFRVSDDRIGFEKYYANVFCFLCNVPTGTNKIDTCEIINSHANMKGTLINFYAILDLNMLGESEMTTVSTTCELTQIWDRFSKLCRQLFCPVGQIPHNGTCKGIFKNIHGYTFALHFKVFIMNGTVTTEKLFLDIIIQRLNRKLGNDVTCGTCQASLLSNVTSPLQLFLRYETFTTHGCPYDTIFQRFRKLAIKSEINIQFKYRNEVIRLSLILIFEDIGYPTGLNTLVHSKSSFCHHVTVIDASILFYCPKIMLSKDEVSSLGLKNVSSVFKNTTSKANNSVAIFQVCIDNYFSAKKNEHNFCHGSQPQTIWNV